MEVAEEARKEVRKEARREAKKKAEEEAKDGGDAKKPKESSKTGMSKDAAGKAQDQKGKVKDGERHATCVNPYFLMKVTHATNASIAVTQADNIAAPICQATCNSGFESTRQQQHICKPRSIDGWHWMCLEG